jgi:hypothetical protein
MILLLIKINNPQSQSFETDIKEIKAAQTEIQPSINEIVTVNHPRSGTFAVKNKQTGT